MCPFFRSATATGVAAEVSFVQVGVANVSAIQMVANKPVQRALAELSRRLKRMRRAVHRQQYPVCFNYGTLRQDLRRAYRFIHPQLVSYLAKCEAQAWKKQQLIVEESVHLVPLDGRLSWPQIHAQVKARQLEVAPPEVALAFGGNYQEIVHLLARSLVAGSCSSFDQGHYATSLSFRPNVLEGWVTYFDETTELVVSAEHGDYCLAVAKPGSS